MTENEQLNLNDMQSGCELCVYGVGRDCAHVDTVASWLAGGRTGRGPGTGADPIRGIPPHERGLPPPRRYPAPTALVAVFIAHFLMKLGLSIHRQALGVFGHDKFVARVGNPFLSASQTAPMCCLDGVASLRAFRSLPNFSCHFGVGWGMKLFHVRNLWGFICDYYLLC